MKLSGSILFFTIVISFLLSTSSAQSTQNNRLIINMSESEVIELNFRRELLFKSRTEFDITSETEPEEMLALVSQKLVDAGWTANWQKEREDIAESYTANFFARGGANLQLELTRTSAEIYRLLIYRY